MIRELRLLSLVFFILLVFCISTKIQAQLLTVWEHDFSSYGIFTGDFSDYDDNGNIYIAYNNSGIGVIKLDTAGTILYNIVYPTSEEISSIWADNAGGVYVIANNWSTSHTLTPLKIYKFDAYGNLTWSEQITPSNDYYSQFIHTDYVRADNNGNLWIAFNNPISNTCYPDVGSDHLFQAQLYRITPTGSKLKVLDYQPDGVMSDAVIEKIDTDSHGNIHIILRSWKSCCQAGCTNCSDYCYTVNGEPSDFQMTTVVQSYSSGGGLISETTYDLTGPNCDSYFPYCKELTLFGGKRNGFVTVVTDQYAIDVLECEYQSVIYYNGWSTTINKAVSAALTDEAGNLYIRTRTCDNSKSTAYPEYDLTKLDGGSGSELWTIPNALTPAYIADGYMYRTHGSHSKVDLDGNVEWVAPIGGILLWVDSDYNHYFVHPYDYKVTRYHEGSDIMIKDHNEDPITLTEFELIKVNGEANDYTEDTLGMFTTNIEGKLKTEVFGVDSFRVETSGGIDTLTIGDYIKISKHVYSEPAIRHPGVLGTMYSVYLESGDFSPSNELYYDAVAGMPTQDIILSRSEFRYNLLASIEWDATTEYINSLRASIRNMANYLYDLTDGQIRLDTVLIYDKADFFTEADLQIYSNNYQWPQTHSYGIKNPYLSSIMMPRKFYGDSIPNRNESANDTYPIDINNPTNYRTMTHEFGHFALGFYDEYLYVGPNGRCASMSKPPYFGFMDRQYESGEPYASEMSNQYIYADLDCRNTRQYIWNGDLSCWDFLELEKEASYGPDNIYIPILKPDLSNDQERLITGNSFPGPNEFGQSLTCDVGNMIHFGGTTAGQDIGVGNLPVYVALSLSATGIKGADVTLKKPYDDGSGYYSVYQGKTSDLGLIYLLGADRLRDQATASTGHVFYAPNKSSNFVLDDRIWYYGSLDLSETSVDTAIFELTPVYGDYSMIPDITLNEFDAGFKVDFETEFASIPELNHSTHDTTYNYSVSLLDSAYFSTITDSLYDKGLLTINAIDDSSKIFFVDFSYASVNFPDSIASRQLYSHDNKAFLRFDSTTELIERAVILSSGYPIMKTGLTPDAIQIGDVYSIAFYPETDLLSGNVFDIAYYEDELLKNGYLINEMDLQMYYWNSVSRNWEAVQSYVDRVANVVSIEMNQDGTYALFAVATPVDVNDENGYILPYNFELSQNYPNPFNPITTVEYSLPRRSHVQIEIYNVLGQRVNTLVDRDESAGSYSVSWDGKTVNGQPVATGVYLYRFQAGDYVETKKMLLLK